MTQLRPNTQLRELLSAREVYKPSGRGSLRAQLSRVGPLQSLILEYAVRVAEVFMLSDIVVYRKNEYDTHLDRRRMYDAAQRLVKRGVLVRVKREWYRLADSVDLSENDVKLEKHGESLLNTSPIDRKDKLLEATLGALRVFVGCDVVDLGVGLYATPRVARLCG
jgi:hypothetical protein